MATSITPLSTLYDHPNVFRIPKHGDVSKPAEKKQDSILTEEEETDLSDVEQARNAVKTALEGRKYQNLNDMLIPAPERPEFDQERAEKAKRLAKRAAIVQLIDSIASAGQMAAGGDSTIVAPVDYSGLGFEALNQLVDLDEQHQIDLRDFNKQKRDVELKNQQIRQGAREFNQDVDLDLAKFVYNDLLNRDKKEQTDEKNERRWHYEAGLRYLSQGKYELAKAHFMEAGLNPDGTEKKKTSDEIEPPQKSKESEPLSEAATKEASTTSPEATQINSSEPAQVSAENAARPDSSEAPSLVQASPSEEEGTLNGPQQSDPAPDSIASTDPTALVDEEETSLAGTETNRPVVSEGLGDMQTLESVKKAIENSLANEPDEQTRLVLLDRWKEVTRELLKANPDVWGEDWWTERLYDDLLTDLNTGQLANKSKKKTTFMDLVKFWPRVFNFFAKVFQHPVAGKKNQESFHDFIDTADLENQKSWSELRETWKDNQKALLDEYLPRQNVSQPDSPEAKQAERTTLHQIQEALGNDLAGKLDSDTRLELTRRWIKNNERLLELERPDLTEQQRHTFSLEMFPQMIKEKQAERQSDRPSPESIEPPTDLQPDRDRDSRGRLEIQDIRNTGQI